MSLIAYGEEHDSTPKVSGTVMILRGAATGEGLPHDGQYLKAFDFEANEGRGEITMTPNIEEAKVFADPAEAFAFYRTSPQCRPTREDGRPNRPLTATNWEFTTGPEQRS